MLTLFPKADCILKNVVLFAILSVSTTVMAQIPTIKSVLYIGDSITKHAPSKKLGWSGDWGMAATAISKDYVHQFSARLASAQGGEIETIVHAVGGGTIAGKLKDANALSKIKADLIIIQLGENDKDVSAKGFEKPYENLVNLLRASNPASKIICLGVWAPPNGSRAKDKMIRNVCARNKILFADLSAANAAPKGTARTTGLWKHPGVGWHPGDIGMTAYADALWKVLVIGDKSISAGEADVPATAQTPIFVESFECSNISQLKWNPQIGILEPGEKGQCLRLSVTNEDALYLRSDLNAESIKGKNVELTVRVRGEKLSDKTNNGIKIGIDLLNAEGHKDYPAISCDTGTFAWKTIRVGMRIPDNIVQASILIKLEQIAGTVCLDEIRLQEVSKKTFTE